VLNDKLYLNWDAETRDAFVDEQSSRISQAEANWPELHAGRWMAVPTCTPMPARASISATRNS